MGEVNYLHNSKLVKLLKTSDKKEQKRFEEYIISPFFNKNEDVVVLWKFIKKRLPSFEKIPTEKELLDVLYENDEHQKPEQWSPREDTLLRVLMNRLTSLFYDFLTYQIRETKEVQNRYLLINKLVERELHKVTPSLLKATRKLHSKNPYRDSEYYFDEYLLNEVEFTTNVFNRNRGANNHPDKIISSLSNYAFSSLMLYYSAYVNGNQIIGKSESLPKIDKLIEYIESNKDTFSEIVIIYYHMYMMISKKEAEKHYWELKNIIEVFYKYVPKYPLRAIYNLMINFCIVKIKKGEEKFRAEEYDIYNKSIPTGVWNTGLNFRPTHYIEHTINALYLGKYDEIAAFHKEYESKLQPKYIPDVPSLGYAFYHFHLGEYDKSQEYLNKVTDREDFIYTLHYKRLLIKIYYEKQEWFIIESALEALRSYLMPNRSKNISKQYRNHNKNFMNVCKKIVRQRNNTEYGQASMKILKKVQQEIKDKESIAERTWLLEKTEELIAEQVSVSK